MNRQENMPVSFTICSVCHKTQTELGADVCEYCPDGGNVYTSTVTKVLEQ